jgi:hypothetical protein
MHPVTRNALLMLLLLEKCQNIHMQLGCQMQLCASINSQQILMGEMVPRLSNIFIELDIIFRKRMRPAEGPK